MRSASPFARLAAAAVALATLAACSGSVTSTEPLPSPPPSTISIAPTTPSTEPSPTSTAAKADPRLSSFYAQELDWTGCGAYQCATLRVPLDYSSPDPDEIVRLKVLRNRASNPSSRIGTLVVNPGGPGGSGVSYAERSDSVLPAGVRARYDIVGFDPRGVQASRPNIDCITDAQLDRDISSATSVDNAAAQLRDAKAFANGCAKRSPSLYGQVGTRDAAKDLDILRGALGEKKLDYLGKSYGTLLGATYAETFPDRVGRMVLDGVLDPSLDAESLLRGQAKGFETAYRSFLKYCVNNGCPVGSNVDDAYEGTRAWVAGLEDEPLGSAGGRKLTRPLAELALLGSLYEDRVQWASLRSALRSAVTNDSPYAMLALADAAVDRQPGGRYPDNSNEAQYAITCLDRPYPATVEQTADRASRFAEFAPLFGEYIAWGDLPCTEWKTAPTRLPHRLTADVPPILLIGVSRDPATPLSWAESLRDQLPTSRLITWKGDGHTGYFRGSGCVDSTVDRYLLAGTVPADRTCTGR